MTFTINPVNPLILSILIQTLGLAESTYDLYNQSCKSFNPEHLDSDNRISTINIGLILSIL